MPLDPLSLVGLVVALPVLLEKTVSCFDNFIKKADLFKDAEIQILLQELRLRGQLTALRVEIDVLRQQPPALQESLFAFEILDIHKKTLLVTDYLQRIDHLGRTVFVLKWLKKILSLVEDLDRSRHSLVTKLHLLSLRDNSNFPEQWDRADTKEGSQAIRTVGLLRDAIMRRRNTTTQGFASAKMQLGDGYIATRNRLRGSDVWVGEAAPIANSQDNPANKFFIIDICPYTSEGDMQQATRVMNVVNTFYGSLSDRSFMSRTGIAQCQGFVQNTAGKNFELIFDIPPGIKPPRSLRDLLTDPINAQGARHPINDRIRLATMLARSLLFVHAYDYVHKDIRPENILVLEPVSDEGRKSSYPYTIGQPLLVGFGQLRTNSESSKLEGDGICEREIYRHHSRQGTQGLARYSVLHDVYSLGAVLLEIALWTSFLVPSSEDNNHFSLNKEQFKWMAKNEHGLHTYQKRFLHLARTQVALYVGKKYADVVVKCLECVEEGFGDKDLQLRDGIEIGSEYIDNILAALGDISI
ncbi:MAG: hypothetical protein M1840_002868 [Geoglossum simile]|nr:MAG: hypothetical protein M1840_002868 [Geoglossum simile]